MQEYRLSGQFPETALGLAAPIRRPRPAAGMMAQVLGMMKRPRAKKRRKKRFGAGHKPGSVPFRRQNGRRKAMIIPLVPLLPAGSSNLPESLDGPPSNALLFGLAPGGVCLASDVTTGTGELLPHRFTLTPPVRGGLLSVALSCSSPRLGVTQHPALRSPDFPPVPLQGGPAIICPAPNSSIEIPRAITAQMVPPNSNQKLLPASTSREHITKLG